MFADGKTTTDALTMQKLAQSFAILKRAYEDGEPYLDNFLKDCEDLIDQLDYFLYS